MTKYCASCHHEIRATDTTNKWKTTHRSFAECTKAQREGAAMDPAHQKPSRAATVAPAPARVVSARAQYAQHYATSAAPGTCRRCGGPVSVGGAYCGEC